MTANATKEHERICWACHAVYTGPLGPSGKCPNCERGVPADPPLDVWSLNAAKREAASGDLECTVMPPLGGKTLLELAVEERNRPSNQQLSPTENLLQRVKAARDRGDISNSLCTDITNALETYSPVETTPVTPEFAANFERGIVDQVLKEVEALAGDRTDIYWSAHSLACEEIRHRLAEAWTALPAVEPDGRLPAAFQSLLDLQPNWDSYGAKRINRECVQKAYEIWKQLAGTWLPVPHSDGTVGLEQHQGGFDIEIDVDLSLSPENGSPVISEDKHGR